MPVLLTGMIAQHALFVFCPEDHCYGEGWSVLSGAKESDRGDDGGWSPTYKILCLPWWVIYVTHSFLKVDTLSVIYEKLVLVINKLYQCVHC